MNTALVNFILGLILFWLAVLWLFGWQGVIATAIVLTICTLILSKREHVI